MPVKRGTTTKKYQQITEQMIQYIRNGDLRPGDKLPSLTDMAYEFGVSRAAMREAFSALQGMGLIEMRHGEGTFVANLDVKTEIVEPMNAALLLGMNDLQYLHEVRGILELAVVSLACERRSAAELEEISGAIQSLVWGGYEKNILASVDWQVHLALASATGNPVLVNLMSTLSASMQSVTSWLNEGFVVEAVDRWYWPIYDAILQQDVGRARSLMEDYLQNLWLDAEGARSLGRITHQ